MSNPIIINHFSRRREFIQMLRERSASQGVEIGTDHGKYARQLLDGIPDLALWCIDPYVPYIEGNEIHGLEELEKIYKEAIEITKPHYNRCEIIRKTSMEAVKEFDSNNLDFVFIDGNHSYENVLEDVTEWTKKVKPGGIIAGHDYKEDKVNNYGVIKAVQKYTTDNHINPWFILHAGGKLVDCYMWIKQ